MQEWPGLGSMWWGEGRGPGREKMKRNQVSETGLGREVIRVSTLDTPRPRSPGGCQVDMSARQLDTQLLETLDHGHGSASYQDPGEN